MSCYLRHVKPMYPELGVDGEDKAQKKTLDKAIRQELGMADSHCPEVWTALKPKMVDLEFWKKIKTRIHQ